MSNTTEYIRRLWGTLRRRRTDSDLEEELRQHLQQASEDARRRSDNDHAARAARVTAGGVAQAMEELRDQRGLPWLEDLGRDVRHAVRGLRRAPIFASVAVLTLGLGIGANTAIMSIVNGVLLRPLAYAHPSQLVSLTTVGPGQAYSEASVAEYVEFQQFTRAFSDVGAFRLGEANITAGDQARRVRSASVDAHLLHTLALRPAQGRLFTSDETGFRRTPPETVAGDGTFVAQLLSEAIISYDLWQSAFGARAIVGQRVDIDGHPVEIVGIMARGTDLLDSHTQIWLPLVFSEGERRARNSHNLSLVARLREGVSMGTAQAELTSLIAGWATRIGITPGPRHAGHVFVPLSKDRGHALQMMPLGDRVLGRASQSIWVLQAAVGLVLLIACANVANLLLARAEIRQREFAIMTALGAGRGRLLRAAMTESVILAVAGGALGVLLAYVGVAALVRAYPDSLPRIGEVGVDLRVMLVSFAVAFLCGLLFGLAPVTQTRPPSIVETLKVGLRGSSGTPRHNLRRALVMAETGLAVIVVVGAGLLLRTVHNLTAADVGFDRSRLVTFSVTLPPASSDLLGRAHAYQGLLEQLRAVPGILMATAMTALPLDRPFNSNQSEIASSTDRSGTALTGIDFQRVMSSFFETMGIGIVEGRAFQAADAASKGRVAIVNETLASQHWNGRNPIGEKLRPCCGGDAASWFTVVGVARDVKQIGVDRPVGPEAYVLVDQLATASPNTWVAFSPTTMHVVIRTALPLATLAPTIARVVRDVNPSVPVAGLREMDDVVTDSIRRPRLLAQLLTLFSVLALVLTAIGLYGVLASMVLERRRELGIRLALGAKGAQLLRQVMAQGLRLAGAGVAVGLAGALGLNRVVASLLFGVEGTDAMTFAIAITSILTMAMLACWLPAWRASRLDPNLVLRAD
jgi:predicted permease